MIPGKNSRAADHKFRLRDFLNESLFGRQQAQATCSISSLKDLSSILSCWTHIFLILQISTKIFLSGHCFAVNNNLRL
jgi:hypothetical protein